MKISVQAKPGAREERVEKIDETHFVVAVKEPPIEGRANAAIVRTLAAHFNVASSHIRIISGHTSRRKTVEIYETKN